MTYDVVHIEAHQLLTEEDKADSHVGDVLHFHLSAIYHFTAVQMQDLPCHV